VLGWLPTWLLMRTRLWTYRRRLDAFERTRTSTVEAVPAGSDEEPVE